jgi:DNA-binding CsgD family transcriptional regulator
MEEVEFLPMRPLELLPDTERMLSGDCFRDLLPEVSRRGPGAPWQFDGGYSASIRYTEEEIADEPILALSPAEYRTLRLHMQGMPRREIAQIEGITEMAVGMRLRKHRVKAAKARLMEGVDEELEALTGEALDVYRDAVRSSDLEMRLKAAEKIFKVNGKGVDQRKKSGEGDLSAAEFMGTLLKNIHSEINISVGLNDYERAATKSLDGNVRRISDAVDIEDSE